MLDEFEGGLFRRIREGEMPDDGWGYVYYDPCSRWAVTAPIPWNIVAAAIRRGWLFLRCWPMTWRLEREAAAYELGRLDGKREGLELGRDQVFFAMAQSFGGMAMASDKAAAAFRDMGPVLKTLKAAMKRKHAN